MPNFCFQGYVKVEFPPKITISAGKKIGLKKFFKRIFFVSKKSLVEFFFIKNVFREKKFLLNIFGEIFIPFEKLFLATFVLATIFLAFKVWSKSGQ